MMEQSPSNFKAVIDSKLQELLLPVEQDQKNLFESANYSLFPGKRLRPILTLTIMKMLNNDIQQAITPACCIEFIHTYTLIHDDLPCMDDDDVRRGKPSLHKAYSEWLALLTGDFFLSFAFEVLSQHSLPVTDNMRLELIRTLSFHCGSKGLITGQIMDVMGENSTKVDMSYLKKLHDNKTSSLIVASIEFASILSDIKMENRKVLESFGRCLGLVYQITDDILDVTSTEEVLGKPINSDIDKNKATAVSLLGMDGAISLSQDLYTKAIELVSQLPYNTKELLTLVNSLIKREF
jgi:geranylgeranyl diphosphate synthase, type II